MSKYFITAALNVFISELVKRSDKFGALMAGLPLVTGSTRKNSESCVIHIWYVVATLPLFLVFPALLPRIGFWQTLIACVVITIACFGVVALLVRRFGIELL